MNTLSRTLDHQFAVLEALSGDAESAMASHVAARAGRLWMPSQLLYSASETPLDPISAIAIVVNLLTEEGLPSFSVLLSKHLGDTGVWQRWSDQWVGEEDRHGQAINGALRFIPIIDPVVVERMQYEYLCAGGFRPSWGGSPYELLAYTVLQERATQKAHAAIAQRVRGTFLARLFGQIAGEEWGHCCFYRSVFAGVFARDMPGALVAFHRVVHNFYMPGKEIPGFLDLEAVTSRGGIFSASDYADIVEEAVDFFNIPYLHIDDLALEELRREILERPRRLRAVHTGLMKRPPRNRSFNFLVGDKIVAA